MSIFSQTLAREVRTWFRDLVAGSIADMTNFHRMFIERWERKKNPLQILYEYENIRRGPKESVQDYYTRFNNTYNSIPTSFKPTPDLAMIKFLDGFDLDMAYHLRERDPATLEQSQTNAVKVEANLLAKKAQAKLERRVGLGLVKLQLLMVK